MNAIENGTVSEWTEDRVQSVGEVPMFQETPSDTIDIDHCEKRCGPDLSLSTEHDPSTQLLGCSIEVAACFVSW